MENARRARVVPLIIVVGLSLGACGDDDAGSGAEQPSVTTVPPAPATDVPISGNLVELRVNADDTSAYGQVEQVVLGQNVVLALLSDTDRDYRVHGYELAAAAPAGTERVFEFVADQAGRFDVEDRVSGDVIRVLEVG